MARYIDVTDVVDVVRWRIVLFSVCICDEHTKNGTKYSVQTSVGIENDKSKHRSTETVCFEQRKRRVSPVKENKTRNFDETCVRDATNSFINCVCNHHNCL